MGELGLAKIDKAAAKHFKRAWELYYEDDWLQATHELTAAIELDSEWGQPHLLRGQIYFFDEKNKNVSAATQEFRRVVELEPEWDEGYHWLAAALSDSNSIEEAVAMSRQAVRFARRDPRHHIQLGVLLTQQGTYTESILSLRKGIKLKPHYGLSDAHLFLAEALMADNQVAEACKQWRIILTLEPMHPSYEHPHKEAKRLLKIHDCEQ